MCGLGSWRSGCPFWWRWPLCTRPGGSRLTLKRSRLTLSTRCLSACFAFLHCGIRAAQGLQGPLPSKRLQNAQEKRLRGSEVHLALPAQLRHFLADFHALQTPGLASTSVKLNGVHNHGHRLLRALPSELPFLAYQMALADAAGVHKWWHGSWLELVVLLSLG